MALGQRAGWPFLSTFCPSPPLDPAKENPEMAPPPHQHPCAPKGSERSRGGHHGGAGLCPTRGARRAAGGERAGSHVRAGRGQPARPRRERPVPLPVLHKDTQRRGGRGRGRLSGTLRGGGGRRGRGGRAPRGPAGGSAGRAAVPRPARAVTGSPFARPSSAQAATGPARRGPRAPMAGGGALPAGTAVTGRYPAPPPRPNTPLPWGGAWAPNPRGEVSGGAGGVWGAERTHSAPPGGGKAGRSWGRRRGGGWPGTLGSMSPTTKNLTSLNISSGTFSSSSSADMVPPPAPHPPPPPSPISPALAVEKHRGPGLPSPSPRRAAEPREQGARCGTHHPPPGRRGGERGRGEPPGQSGSPRPISHPRCRRTPPGPEPRALPLLLPPSPNRTGSQHPAPKLPPPYGTQWTRPDRQRQAAGIPGPAHRQTGEGRGEGSAPPSGPAPQPRPWPRPRGGSGSPQRLRRAEGPGRAGGGRGALPAAGFGVPSPSPAQSRSLSWASQRSEGPSGAGAAAAGDSRESRPVAPPVPSLCQALLSSPLFGGNRATAGDLTTASGDTDSIPHTPSSYDILRFPVSDCFLSSSRTFRNSTLSQNTQLGVSANPRGVRCIHSNTQLIHEHTDYYPNQAFSLKSLLKASFCVDSKPSKPRGGCSLPHFR